jgi:Fe-S oxidoreductase
MLTTPERVAFLGIILITAIAFAVPVLRRLRLMAAGRPEKRLLAPLEQIVGAFTKVFFQRCTLRNERIATGFMHVLIFYSALSFDTMTVSHTLEGFIPEFFLFGRTRLGLLFSGFLDLAAILVLCGVAFFAVRRFIIKPKAYATTRGDSAVIYIALTVVTLSYVYFEAFAVAHHPEAVRWSFFGRTLASLISGGSLSAAAIAAQFRISWWVHILLVYAFIAYVPHSKYFHMFTGPFNVLFGAPGSSGRLKPLDIEGSEVFGLEKAPDLTWKDTLDTFACMECGRCQDVCPAFASDKPLSPKMILFNLEKHLLAAGKKILGGKRDDLPTLCPDVHTSDEIWTCTTCGACMHVCPVEIEHIRKIVGVRQSEVLMQSRFPQELNPFFRNMETNSNPWGIGFSERAAWAEGLDVPLLADHPQAEYLYWVGCAGSFDEEGKKTARAFVSILKAAGVDFAILGTEEKCCGDQARRLGNEYLFQSLALENMTVFTRYKVRKIITGCPHGYNTLKNEYPGLADAQTQLSPEDKALIKSIEVHHAVEILDDLLNRGILNSTCSFAGPLTYHDPCYLARHNRLVDAPRRVLGQVCASGFRELGRYGEHGFCCGAGGGLMWTEERLGKRINHLRAEEVIASGAALVAVSCPFCQTMLRDALKDKDRPDIQVKDIIQLTADALSRAKDPLISNQQLATRD